jgi:hypothetical protein
MPSEAADRQDLTLTLIPFVALTNVTDKFRVRVRVWLCAGRAEREAVAIVASTLAQRFLLFVMVRLLPLFVPGLIVLFLAASVKSSLVEEVCCRGFRCLT